MVTSPEQSAETDFAISGNYYFSLVVKGDLCTVSFPVCRANTLVSFVLKNLFPPGALKDSSWFGYGDDGSGITVPPDRPGFHVEDASESKPEVLQGYSKIFWKMDQEVKTMNTSWSGHPVFFMHVGSSYPAVAFLNSGKGLFAAVGDTPDRALLNSIHLFRTGIKTLKAESGELMKRIPDTSLGEPVRNNLLMNMFFSNSRCTDTGEDCIMASKSPEYYVSTGFWSRDFVFWSLPALERTDPERVKELLETYLQKYSSNPGVHALYLDGRVLYDGFELDEMAAHITAVSLSVARGIIGRTEGEEMAAGAMDIIEKRRHSEFHIYSTELNSSDDPVFYPYVTYSNAILRRSLADLSESLGEGRSGHFRGISEEMRRSILEKMVEPSSGMFAYSSDLRGSYRLYDDPTGSLILLPRLGLVKPSDERYIKTIEWIKSGQNEFFINGKFPGCGNAHVKHPWIHYFASLFLVKDPDCRKALEIPSINGPACETIDENTGNCYTGVHFPGAAGYLSESILSYLEGL